MSTVKLLSSDNVVIEVEQDVAESSSLIRQLLEDEPDTNARPLFIAKVNSEILEKVLTWCRHHERQISLSATPDRRKTTEMTVWDQKYFQVDQEVLFEIILAAYVLEITSLTHAGCQIVANMIKGKSPEEIRQTFNIQNDFTPEEEEQIRRENEWAEDRAIEPAVWQPGMEHESAGMDATETSISETKIKHECAEDDTTKLSISETKTDHGLVDNHDTESSISEIKVRHESVDNDDYGPPVSEIAIKRQDSEITFQRKKGRFSHWKVRVSTIWGKKV